MSGSGMAWPSSTDYLTKVYSAVRAKMTSCDLFSLGAIGWRGLLDFNVGLICDRASVLARLLERNWGVSGTLADPPDAPHWLINATCIETGKNWRFAKREMGDWNFGRHYAPEVPLAVAAAASAAVPYVIGAVDLPLPPAGWWETDPATDKQVRTRAPSRGRVRMWDGGAYDNMGLEAVTKPGKGLRHCDFLICSDASGQLRPPGRSPLAALLGGRLLSPRLFDVAGDLIRALRSRVLIADIASGTVDGVLLRMGNSVRAVDVKNGLGRPVGFYDRFQTDEQAATALQYPTDLRALSPAGFDALARHGFEVADHLRRPAIRNAALLGGPPFMRSIRTRFRAYHLGSAGSSFSYFADGHFTMIEARLTEESRAQVEHEMTVRCGVDHAEVLHITSWDADHCNKPMKIECPGYDPYKDSGHGEECLEIVAEYRSRRRNTGTTPIIKHITPQYIRGLEPASAKAFRDTL